MTLSAQELETLRARLRALREQVGGSVSDRLHRHGLDQHEDAALPNRRLDTDDDAAAESATHNGHRPCRARCGGTGNR